MSPLSLRLLRAAFLYLACGIALGVCFALDRTLGVALRPLHAELNLWGWLTLLVYGMAYHMFPRFSGRALAWPKLAEAQSWLAIAGVALAALGWWGTYTSWGPAEAMRLAAGGIELLAAGLFVANLAPLLRTRTEIA